MHKALPQHTLFAARMEVHVSNPKCIGSRHLRTHTYLDCSTALAVNLPKADSSASSNSSPSLTSASSSSSSSDSSKSDSLDTEPALRCSSPIAVTSSSTSEESHPRSSGSYMISRSESESFKLRFLFLSLANSFICCMRLLGRAIVYSRQRAAELMLVNGGVDGGE